MVKLAVSAKLWCCTCMCELHVIRTLTTNNINCDLLISYGPTQFSHVCHVCTCILCCTDEVRVKTQHLERTQAKLRSAEEDNSDLQAEFEVEREDYLDTIRKQERMIKLQEQLIGTIVPCLRRDCNYFNIDKVRGECVWDDDHSQWILPKLVVSKTTLVPVDTKPLLTDRRMSSSSPNKIPKHISSPDVQSKVPSNHRIQQNYGSGGTQEPMVQPSCYDQEEDKYHKRLTKIGGESDYFKPKRALELLNQGKNDVNKPQEYRGSGSLPSLDSARKTHSTSSIVPNAAAVHGVEALVMNDGTYTRRPGKLQSLPKQPPKPDPQLFSPQHEPNIIEKVEKKLSNRKRTSLEPLSDLKPKRPF